MFLVSSFSSSVNFAIHIYGNLSRPTWLVDKFCTGKQDYGYKVWKAIYSKW